MPGPTFSDVLENACRSAGVNPDTETSGHRVRRSRSGASHLQDIADRIAELAGRASAATAAFNPYLEHARDSAPAHRKKKKSADPKAVADELCITREMTFADLKRLRREFALANHPDVVETAERADATRRMMLANMLIDRELKRRTDPTAER
jgi:hypothetical protein